MVRYCSIEQLAHLWGEYEVQKDQIEELLIDVLVLIMLLAVA